MIGKWQNLFWFLKLLYFGMAPDPFEGFLRALSIVTERHMPRLAKKKLLSKKQQTRSESGMIRLYSVTYQLVIYIVKWDQHFHSFIHSGYFYSASSSPLLLRGAPDTARILCRSFTLATASEGLAQGPYVAARAGFEPMTLLRQATNLPMSHHAHDIILFNYFILLLIF